MPGGWWEGGASENLGPFDRGRTWRSRATGPRVSPEMAFAMHLSPQLGNSVPILTDRSMQGLSRGCGLKTEEQLHPLDPGLDWAPRLEVLPLPSMRRAHRTELGDPHGSIRRQRLLARPKSAHGGDCALSILDRTRCPGPLR